jgi:electron transfer flavoprotein alpha subunit
VRLPAQGGKAYAELSAGQGPTVLATLRPNTYASLAGAREGSPEVLSVQPDLGGPSRVIDEGFEPIAGGRVPLEEAEVVVAGGRGVGDGFALVEELADVLGGAVAASRAVVDARLRPVEEQVGKSGKTVSPRLYFAVGISGAVHHTMGMDTSGTVVAINNDPAAPIFGQADFGLVGSAAEVLPVLTQRLKG